MKKELWFVTGSQHLYGPKTLEQVAADSKQIAAALNADKSISVNVVWKPTVKTPDEIYALCRDANADEHCIGLITWMHTFSPAKMWIAGLTALKKPFVHLHTQFGRDIPWNSIDMDFMNLNQSAHGDREFGFICSRLRKNRTVIVGHWKDKEVRAELAVWARVAIAPEGTGYCGRDGRTVSVPKDWGKDAGSDQRLVAIPPQGSAKRGGDGRAIAVPKGWSFKAGTDGRGVAVPPGGKALSGKDKRLVAVPEGWTSVEGKDGRVTAVPPEATTETGDDERIIAVPKGWTSATGGDNRMVAIPPGGEFLIGADQRATPLPPDSFDLTDYVTLYCILDAQAETQAEEEADAAE